MTKLDRIIRYVENRNRWSGWLRRHGWGPRPEGSTHPKLYAILVGDMVRIRKKVT